jgi:hypothetical protein
MSGTSAGACPEGATWLAYWDDELTPLQTEAVERHLATCVGCRAQLRGMVGRLAAVDPTGSTRARGARRAARPASRAVLGVGAAAVLLAVTAASPFGRSVMASVANTYTVSHLQVVSVTRGEMKTMFQQVTQNGHASLARYGSVSESGLRQKPTAVPASQLTSATGLTNLWPAGLAMPATALVGTGGHVTFQLHVQALNALILDEGGSHLFPAALSGVPFTVQVPARALWVGAANTNAAGVTVAESQVPTLVVPGGVNTREVWSAVQGLPFLPAPVSQALAAMPTPGATALVPVSAAGQGVSFQGHRAVVEKTPKGWVLLYLHGKTLVALYRAGSGGMSAAQFVNWAASIYR